MAGRSTPSKVDKDIKADTDTPRTTSDRQMADRIVINLMSDDEDEVPTVPTSSEKRKDPPGPPSSKPPPSKKLNPGLFEPSGARSNGTRQADQDKVRLMREVADLKTALLVADGKLTESREYKSKFEEAEASLNQFREERSRLEDQVDAQLASQQLQLKERSGLESELAEKIHLFGKGFETARSDGSSQTDDLGLADEEKTILQDELAAIRKTCESQKAKIRATNKALEESNLLAWQKKEADALVTQLTAQVSLSKADCSNAQSQISKLQKNLRDSQDESHKAKDDVKDMDQILSKNAACIKALEDEKARLRNQVQVLESQKYELESAATSLSNKAEEAAKAQISELQRELGKEKTAVTALKKESDEFCQKLASITVLELERKALQGRMTTMEGEFGDKAKMEGLQQKLNTAEGRLRELENELEAEKQSSEEARAHFGACGLAHKGPEFFDWIAKETKEIDEALTAADERLAAGLAVAKAEAGEYAF